MRGVLILTDDEGRSAKLEAGADDQMGVLEKLWKRADLIDEHDYIKKGVRNG